MIKLNLEKRNKNNLYPTGLYIEIKVTDYYIDDLGINVNAMLFEKL
jgi:hypothetical protein